MRMGIDFGGTKIEICALDDQGGIRLRRRVPTPPSYDLALGAVQELVRGVERELGEKGTLGIGIPGALSPATGRVRNANTPYMNGVALDTDLAALLDREVRVENDANCFALSEAVDGAGAGAETVFGVILGTGCGGGVVVGRKALSGRHHIAGEWGHTPLPWPRESELPYKKCFCGNSGCLEKYISGTGLAEDFYGAGQRDATKIESLAQQGDLAARAALARHADRLARGLAVMIHILDPDVIVIGGGLSNMAHLYHEVPILLRQYVIADQPATPVRPAKHGDSSGVRGAAWLW